MKKYLSFFLLIFSAFGSYSQETDYRLQKNIPYVSAGETDAYRLERCRLDLYYPAGKKDFSTVVWFHGGGLESGEKHIPAELKNQGFAVVAVNYRLSPRAKNPAYIEDAAEAIAWVFHRIAGYGGSPSRIFVSGHSAGGYLTLITTLDKSYLARYGVDADDIAAAFPISGQTTTHFTIRKERDLPPGIPLIDAFAPSNRARKEASPLILITGDRRLEMTARYEENAHLAAVLRHLGQQVTLYEIQGFDHGTVLGPACQLIRDYIKKAF